MSNVRYSAATVPSGTQPYLLGYPTPAIEGQLVHRDGANNNITNWPDASAWRLGDTTQITLNSSTPTRIDIPIIGRRAIALCNLSLTETIWFGFRNNITTTGSTGGFPLFPRDKTSLDLSAHVSLWGITTSSSAIIAVMEIG